jgi:hypothetical protein
MVCWSFSFAQRPWSFQGPTPVILILGPMSLWSAKWVLRSCFDLGLYDMALANNPLNIVICAWRGYTLIFYPLNVFVRFSDVHVQSVTPCEVAGEHHSVPLVFEFVLKLRFPTHLPLYEPLIILIFIEEVKSILNDRGWFLHSLALSAPASFLMPFFTVI